MATNRPGLILLSITCAVMACSTHETTSPPPETPLRVVTWNVHGCADGVQPVLDTLRELDADVICLQEAWVATDEAANLDQPRQIADALGMHHFSAGSALPDGTEQRMAILSRHALQNTQLLDADTGRIYGVTATIVHEDRTTRVFSIHLTSSYRLNVRHALETSRARYAEAKHLSGLLRPRGSEVIVAGDFNCLPGMADYDLIVEGLADPSPDQATYPSSKPTLPLDHICHSSGLRTQLHAVQRCLASDHLPVLAVLKIEPETRAPR